MSNEFDPEQDEELYAIDAMMTWRERGEWPPLRRELHELERILDREMGPATRDIEPDISSAPEELAEMGLDPNFDPIDWENE